MFICQVPVCRDDEFVDCLASIVNDIADLHYVDIVFGGDVNVDLSVSDDLCYSLLHFAQELGLKFVYEKLPPDSKTFRVYWSLFLNRSFCCKSVSEQQPSCSAGFRQRH